jgi:hypothetical protein
VERQRAEVAVSAQPQRWAAAQPDRGRAWVQARVLTRRQAQARVQAQALPGKPP